MWKQFFSFSSNERLFETMFQMAQAPLCLTNHNGTIQYANNAFICLMGYGKEELIGNSLAIFHSNRNESSFVDGLFEYLNRKKKFSTDLWQTHQDGQAYLHHIDVSEVRTSETYYLFAHHDITKWMELQEKYRYLAYHDPLTGIANRILLEDRLTHAINNAVRTGMKLGIVFCDINEFKAHNDEYGHLMGDKLLQEVASRIQSVCRISDTVARFGGDEFVVLVENLNHENELREIVKHITDQVSVPFFENKLHLTLSVGLSIFPQDGMTKEQLINNADQRMYRQKMEYHGIIG